MVIENTANVHINVKKKKEKEKKLCKKVMFSLFCIVLKIYHISLLNRKKSILSAISSRFIDFYLFRSKVYFQHDEDKTKVIIFFSF